jgi:acetone carboxylase gamma subunit
MPKVDKCKCGKRLRKDRSGWAFGTHIYNDDTAEVVEPICPACVSPAQAAEVARNDFALQSARAIDGRLLVWPTTRRPRLPLFCERN